MDIAIPVVHLGDKWYQNQSGSENFFAEIKVRMVENEIKVSLSRP